MLISNIYRVVVKNQARSETLLVPSSQSYALRTVLSPFKGEETHNIEEVEVSGLEPDMILPLN